MFLTAPWPQPVEDYLRSRYDVVANETGEPLSSEALLAASREHEILLVNVTDRLPASLFEHPAC